MNDNVYVLRMVGMFMTHYGYTLMAYHEQYVQAVVFNRQHKQYPIIVIDGATLEIPQKNLMTQQLLKNLNAMYGQNFEALYLYLYSSSSVRVGQGFVEDPKVSEQFPKLLELSFMPIEDGPQEFRNLWTKVNEQNKKMLEKQKKQRNRPIITSVLIGVSLVMFFLTVAIGVDDAGFINALIFLGAMYQPFVKGAHEFWRFLTPAFLHGSWFHLLANMYALYNFGRLLEPLYGRLKFGILVLVSVLLGNLFVYFGADTTVTVGMSSGLYGLMAAYILYTFETGIIKIPQMRVQIISLVAINLMVNLFPNISWLGHLGGFIAGLFVALLYSKKPEWQELKKHGLVALTLLIVALGVYRMNSPLKLTVYGGTDRQVVELANRLGFKRYAQNLSEKMVKYYISEGY